MNNLTELNYIFKLNDVEGGSALDVMEYLLSNCLIDDSRGIKLLSVKNAVQQYLKKGYKFLTTKSNGNKVRIEDGLIRMVKLKDDLKKTLKLKKENFEFKFIPNDNSLKENMKSKLAEKQKRYREANPNVFGELPKKYEMKNNEDFLTLEQYVGFRLRTKYERKTLDEELDLDNLEIDNTWLQVNYDNNPFFIFKVNGKNAKERKKIKNYFDSLVNKGLESSLSADGASDAANSSGANATASSSGANVNDFSLPETIEDAENKAKNNPLELAFAVLHALREGKDEELQTVFEKDGKIIDYGGKLDTNNILRKEELNTKQQQRYFSSRACRTILKDYSKSE